MPFFTRATRPRLHISVKGPRIHAPRSARLTPQQLLQLGAVAINAMKDRFRRSLNVRDSSAKALGPSYRLRKVKMGRPGRRDLYLSGRMQSAMTVTSSSRDSVTLGFSRGEEATKMRSNERRERMWGLSPTDQRKVNEALRRMLNENIRRAFARS